MSELTVAKRKKLKRSSFAIPESRSYPVEDHNHRANALARVSAFGTPSQKRRVRAAVHKLEPGMGK